MKKLIAGLLAALMLLGLCGCGVKEEDMVGVWLRETMYLEHYGCEADMLMELYDDGTFLAVLYHHDTQEILNTDYGYWVVDGREILRQSAEDVSYSGGQPVVSFESGPVTRFNVKNENRMTNGDTVWKRVE